MYKIILEEQGVDMLIKEGRAFVHPLTSITYPSNWIKLSQEEKDALGIVYIEEQKKMTPWEFTDLEDRPEFVKAEDGIVTDEPLLGEDGTQVVTVGLKTREIVKVDKQIGSLLAPTDYLGVKEVETGEAIPREEKAYRKAVRESGKEKKELIKACTSKDELKALIESSEFREWPDKNNLPVVVPYQVSMRQARLALLKSGLLFTVDTSITDAEQKIQWDYAQVVRRDDVLVTGIAQLMSPPLTDEQVDDLFLLAETL